MKILLVEDDRAITDSLSEYLGAEGFETVCAPGQNSALAAVRSEVFDLVLLDISLPDGNGYAVCSAVKAERASTPVIFLTASGDEYSTVAGFDCGADDYIAKPFRPRELVSRIRNAIRRSGGASFITRLGDVVVDTVKGTASRGGVDLYLSALEYRLLLAFLNNRGVVMSRSRLLEEIWDIAGDYVNDNTLTVYIKRLRDKLEENPAEPTIIKTVRGLGYKVD